MPRDFIQAIIFWKFQLVTSIDVQNYFICDGVQCPITQLLVQDDCWDLNYQIDSHTLTKPNCTIIPINFIVGMQYKVVLVRTVEDVEERSCRVKLSCVSNQITVDAFHNPCKFAYVAWSGSWSCRLSLDQRQVAWRRRTPPGSSIRIKSFIKSLSTGDPYICIRKA